MMSRPPFNVLFLCTGNSARSILAEALTNDSTITAGRLRGYSAGSHPTGRVHPFAVELLQQHNVPVDQLRSKSWDDFARADAPRIDFVITVCDDAAAESCPIWPGQPITAHWGVPDPARVEGSDNIKRKAFQDAFLVLKRRIESLASLPLDKLSGRALQERLAQIGRE